MKKEILIKFGNKVRKERAKLGLSQEDLAVKAGVHRTYIGMIERGEKNITLMNIKKVAKALELAIDKLLANLKIFENLIIKEVNAIVLRIINDFEELKISAKSRAGAEISDFLEDKFVEY